MKEIYGYIADDFEKEMQSLQKEKTYELPDGQFISLDTERFRPCEILFDASLVGPYSGGIQHITAQSIKSCSIELQATLSNNIIISGGTSMFPGLAER